MFSTAILSVAFRMGKYHSQSYTAFNKLEKYRNSDKTGNLWQEGLPTPLVTSTTKTHPPSVSEIKSNAVASKYVFLEEKLFRESFPRTPVSCC